MALVYPSVVQGFGQGAETGLNLVRGIAELRRGKEDEERKKVLQGREDTTYSQGQEDRQQGLADVATKRQQTEEDRKETLRQRERNTGLEEPVAVLKARKEADRKFEEAKRRSEQDRWSREAEAAKLTLKTESDRQQYYKDRRNVDRFVSLPEDQRKNVVTTVAALSGKGPKEKITPEMFKAVGNTVFQNELNDRIGKEFHNESLEGHGYQLPAGASPSGKSKVTAAKLISLSSEGPGMPIVPIFELTLEDENGMPYTSPPVPATKGGGLDAEVMQLMPEQLQAKAQQQIAAYGIVDQMRQQGVKEEDLGRELYLRAQEAKISGVQEDDVKNKEERDIERVQAKLARGLQLTKMEAAIAKDLKETGMQVGPDGRLVQEAPADPLTPQKGGGQPDYRAAAQAEIQRRAAQGSK